MQIHLNKYKNKRGNKYINEQTEKWEDIKIYKY